MNYGPYVVARPRKDGRVRFTFEVPKRLRPEGWAATRLITLPGVDAIDPNEMTRWQHDFVWQRGEALYAELTRLKGRVKLPPLERYDPDEDFSWARLIEIRRNHSLFKSRMPKTRENLERCHRAILMIFAGEDRYAPRVLRESQLDQLLSEKIKSGHLRKKTLGELRELLRLAVGEFGRPMTPPPKMAIPVEDTEVDCWTHDDLRCLVTGALQADQRGLAKLMLAQWEIGQRLCSVRNFRYGVHYNDGWFFYRCRKTKRPVRIQIDEKVARLLDSEFRHGEFMFLNTLTGEPFTGNQLSYEFSKIRAKTPGYKHSKIILRQLRHTLVLDLARAGCTIAEIASVTGHSFGSMHRVLEHYLPRHDVLAANAMRKRREMRLGDEDGEMIIEGAARRVFLGHVPRAQVPKTLQELGGEL